MDGIRQWLMGITCAALLAALADGLMSKGAIRQIGKLICALVLLCALLRPVLGAGMLEGIATSDVATRESEQRIQLDESRSQLLKTLIELESAA